MTVMMLILMSEILTLNIKKEWVMMMKLLGSLEIIFISLLDCKLGPEAIEQEKCWPFIIMLQLLPTKD